MFNQTKPLFTVLEDIYPLEPVPMNNYAKMSYYNSNRIIPAFDQAVPPKPAQQYINHLEKIYPHTQQVNGIYLPRQTSFQQDAINQTRPLNQFSQFTIQPPFAGGLPYMKNAIINDANVIMNPLGYPVAPVVSTPELEQSLSPYPFYNPKAVGSDLQPINQDKNKESFRYNNTSLDCSSCMQHVLNCPTCMQRFKCEQTIWIILIVMLILMFSVILYLLHNKK